MNRKWLSPLWRATAVAALAGVYLVFAGAALAQDTSAQKKEAEKKRLVARYLELASEIQPARLDAHMRALTRSDSRVVGYDGERQAGDYVRAQFQALFPGRVTEERFWTSVPMDHGDSRIAVAGQTLPLRPLWPNLIRTSQVPKNGLNAPLVYARTGRLADLNGKPVENSIVLVEFNSSSDWLNAPRLGAKAVIFIEPDSTMRGEAESKFLGIPVEIPRFWIARQDAARIIPLIDRQQPPVATLRCNTRWERMQSSNFIGVLDGNPDPQNTLKDQIIVLEAYYDAMSIVPGRAPGAENSLSIASLLEIASVFKRNRPNRTVWFIATSAHFLGLDGIKNYLERHIDELQPETLGEKFGFWLQDHAGFLYGIPPWLRWPIILLLLAGFFVGLFLAFRRSSPGLGFAGVVALLLVPVFLSTQRPSPESRRSPPAVYLFAGLDLSSRSKTVGMFYKGYFYDYREDIQNKFSDIARVTRENSEDVAKAFGQDPKGLFADGVNPIEGKNWRNFFPGKMALDAEVWTLAGGRGVAFASVDDVRPFVDTPFDTPDRINVDNVAQQTKSLVCLIDRIVNDTNSPGEINQKRMPITEASQFSRMGLQGGFATIKGRIVRFDLKESFIPSVPVPESLAVISASSGKTFMGVRGALVQQVDERGRFEFHGVAPLTAYGGQKTTRVQAYHVNPDTGDIDYAPDLGLTGARAYPIEFPVTMATKEVQVVVFNCAATSIYDFVDPQSLKTLTDVNVYDGATNAEPRMYGMAISHPERFQAVVEDAAVFFAQPGFAIKVIMGAGPAAIRFVLINSTDKVPEGIGYQLGKQRAGGELPPTLRGIIHERSYEGTIPNIPLHVTRDMWMWDDYNIRKLRKYRIINQALDMLHDHAKTLLDQAYAAQQARDYARLDAYSRAAWGYEARAYPDVQTTTHDVVKGLMFYLALLLPFAFFVERLLIASTSLRNQIVWFFGIFIAAFLVMRYIHPAFDITTNPMIVLLAFIMLALSVLVITLITGKFEDQLKEFNKQVSGVHKADIGRMSIAAAAFSLGISNMRRRKARSVLTCITLVLLTFIVLSFTSVVTGIRYNIVEAPGTPRYDGIMLRTAMWEQLEESSYRLLNDEFGRTHAVAPRTWFFGAQMGEQTFLTITRGDKKVDARALLGLSPQETQITQPQKAVFAGTWFQPGDIYACIITKEMADGLSISPDEVEKGTARVRYGGVDYIVRGMIDNDNFKAIKDLDQEPITPVDFILMQRQSQGGGAQAQGGADAGFREYTHLEPSSVFIIPYQTLMNQGGEVRSVAIDLQNPVEVDRVRKDLMPRLGLNLYAGHEGRTYRYSSIGSTSIAGAGTLFIPILIAALIVLNTMLNAVFERQKEIHIFSSIGLAPNHVAMLFIAEALVYAVIGAMAGYMVGQGTAKLIVYMHWLPGLNLNFSSVSAVFSTILVMAVVLLSTLYPARKASEVATPAIERSWRTPDPIGDTWVIPLPFMVTGDQATGLNGFLGEWFRAYEEYSIGDFVTQNVETSEEQTDAGMSYRIQLMAWLAPFDLGVSQQVILDTLPTDMADVFELVLTIHRQSGDISNWKRVNRRFLNTLRKQFLIWRTLGTEERERYLAAGEDATAAAAGVGS